MRLPSFLLAAVTLAACSSGSDARADSAAANTPAAAPEPVVAARVPAGALRQVPWLLGTFRGEGAEGTTQAPFYERYSLADDSTLIVEGFKDSTLTGAIDSTRYELRADSLTNPGASRYVAVGISPDSIAFGPLVGVRNGFVWRKGDSTSWTAIIIPVRADAPRRTYRMARLK